MGIVTQKKFDTVWMGLLIGALGAAVGFFIFGIFWAYFNHSSVSFFVHEIFFGSGLFQDKIVTISILLDVVIFYFFIRIQWYNICKGILAILICSVLLAIYLY